MVNFTNGDRGAYKILEQIVLVVIMLFYLYFSFKIQTTINHDSNRLNLIINEEILKSSQNISLNRVTDNYILVLNSVQLESDFKFKKIKIENLNNNSNLGIQTICEMDFAEVDNVYSFLIPKEIVQNLKQNQEYLFTYENWESSIQEYNKVVYTDNSFIYYLHKLINYCQKYIFNLTLTFFIVIYLVNLMLKRIWNKNYMIGFIVIYVILFRFVSPF